MIENKAEKLLNADEVNQHLDNLKQVYQLIHDMGQSNFFNYKVKTKIAKYQATQNSEQFGFLLFAQKAEKQIPVAFLPFYFFGFRKHQSLGCSLSDGFNIFLLKDILFFNDNEICQSFKQHIRKLGQDNTIDYMINENSLLPKLNKDKHIVKNEFTTTVFQELHDVNQTPERLFILLQMLNIPNVANQFTFFDKNNVAETLNNYILTLNYESNYYLNFLKELFDKKVIQVNNVTLAMQLNNFGADKIMIDMDFCYPNKYAVFETLVNRNQNGMDYYSAEMESLALFNKVLSDIHFDKTIQLQYTLEVDFNQTYGDSNTDLINVTLAHNANKQSITFVNQNNGETSVGEVYHLDSLAVVPTFNDLTDNSDFKQYFDSSTSNLQQSMKAILHNWIETKLKLNLIDENDIYIDFVKFLMDNEIHVLKNYDFQTIKLSHIIKSKNTNYILGNKNINLHFGIKKQDKVVKLNYLKMEDGFGFLLEPKERIQLQFDFDINEFKVDNNIFDFKLIENQDVKSNLINIEYILDLSDEQVKNKLLNNKNDIEKFNETLNELIQLQDFYSNYLK